MKDKKLLPAGIGALLVIAAVIFAKFMPGAAKANAEVKEAKAPLVEVKYFTPDTLKNQLQATGKLTSKERFEVYAQVEGSLLASAKSFKEGNTYRKGQPILSIDKGEYAMTLLAQKSNFLSAITAIIPDLKADFPESYPQWQKYLDQMDINKSLKALPTPVSEKEKYYLAGKGVYNAFYSIKSGEERLSKYTIYAPFSGVVTKSNVDAGLAVRPGMQLGEMIRTDVFEVALALPLKEAGQLSKGDKVTLSSPDIQGEWKGTVARIGGNLDPKSQLVNIFVMTSGKGLKEGMFMQAMIEGNTLEGVVEIPRKLLKNSKVYIVEGNNRKGLLKQKYVEVVAVKENTAMVKGVSTKDAILMTTMKSAYEGMEVTIK
ncbi:HlyD family efflux transporter periplasmic adaptor subunit [Algivirga pacifica]|uniref:Efflux RND transporter periplasmic adaptor subunit n=1 Tax=Algivirga pacifica TaxID=1162670 RepID=A0ABP9D9F8_9BACT